MSDARTALLELVLSPALRPDQVRDHQAEIHGAVREQSRYLREADFTAIHPRDLAFLFKAYDERFFSGLCRPALNGRSLTFRLSERMTRAGGKTTRFHSRLTGETRFEITIAASMLFEGFGNTHRNVAVCGLECQDRLEALQRVFEHELIHLVEHLCWDCSDCAAARFQKIAGGLFRHEAHTHQLVTWRERAVVSGIGPGARVQFVFEGRTMTGRVNRVTKRATVLVEDPGGELFSDGRRYLRFYVPLEQLRRVTP